MFESMLPNKITQDMIDDILDNAKIEVAKVGEKTTVVVCTLHNGFVIVESSSCVDPANYNENLGTEICMGKIEDKIWEYEGYMLAEMKSTEAIMFMNADDEGIVH